MNIQIKGNHLVVTEALEQRVKEQISALEERDFGITSIEVVLSCTNDKSENKKAQITVTAKGKTLVAVETKADMYQAIDGVSDKILVQLQKRKDKINNKKGHSSVKDLEVLEE